MGTWCRVIAVRRSGQYAVIGLGRFGSRVAAGLYNAGAEVIAIDTDPHNVDAVKADVTTAVTMDATSKDALRSLALDELDAVVVAIGRDTEASILVTALLRELGCKRIVARAGSNLHADILRRVGATQVVYPEDDIAAGLVRSLASPRVIDLVELEGDLDFALLRIPDSFVGKSLRELELRNRYGLTVVALRTVDEETLEPRLVMPGPDDTLRAGDQMYVVGSEDALERIDQLS